MASVRSGVQSRNAPHKSTPQEQMAEAIAEAPKQKVTKASATKAKVADARPDVALGQPLPLIPEGESKRGDAKFAAIGNGVRVYVYLSPEWAEENGPEFSVTLQ